MCRYYLRNNASLEPLVPDDVAQGILREVSSVGSVLLMRNVSSLDVAVQLTRRDFELFRSIEPSEYVSDLFELEAADRDGHRQSSLNLDKFSEVTTSHVTACWEEGTCCQLCYTLITFKGYYEHHKAHLLDLRL